jgi:UDP-N-acetylmuramate: L-alanyl-gamma-D-glutamyl-meso-diaminopimelate ligase
MQPKTGNIFLSAICGTAMASLAGMLKQAGYRVSGSDNAVYPPMSTFLEELDIPIYEGFSAENIRECDPDVVVIGNTLSRGNPEVEFVLNEGIRYASMAETVKELFIRGRRSIVVSGTHGKTTTTAMLAWMLESAGRSPSFLVGGIAENFGSSFQVGSGTDFVIEGDEYDTAFFDKGPKFLHYMPRIALIKNIEFDHADIYANIEAIQLSFKRLMNIVPGDGLIVAGTDSPAVAELLDEPCSRIATFGIRSGDWRAESIEVGAPGTGFDVVRKGNLWRRFQTPLVGEFNVQNALSAIIACDEVGLSGDEIQAGLESFKSVRRRLEIRGEVDGVTVYDDFAHHPTAVTETLRGVRAQHPDARIWAIFEPRSQTSRRRIFENDFATALGNADIAVVAPPFSTTHLDPENVTRPDAMVAKIRAEGKQAYSFGSTAKIVEFVAANTRPADRLVVMSNGGFENIHQRLLDALAGR